MNIIKFSHDYLKFNKNKLPFKAMLLQTFICERSDLNGTFVNYDTAYWDHTQPGGINYYELPPGKIMVLLFSIRDGYAIPENFKFTTIRRYTPENFEYYKRETGNVFDVVRCA